VVQLSPDALAEVRTKVLLLEKRAYESSKEVYGRTSPAEGPVTALAASSGETMAQSGSPAGPASMPRTGADSAHQWRVELLLALGLGLGAAGWLVRRRAARS
jgi:hypothetical protein